MSKSTRALRSAVAAAGGLAILGAALGMPAGEAAAQHSQRVQNACRGDYNRFCPGYPVESSALRQCMRSAGKALSKRCLDALVDEGEIPRKALKR
jgi:hypothetical protein